LSLTQILAKKTVFVQALFKNEVVFPVLRWHETRSTCGTYQDVFINTAKWLIKITGQDQLPKFGIFWTVKIFAVTVGKGEEE
jgi:hypothetical protein